MNTATYTPLLDSIEIPGTDRTLGGEKAVKTLPPGKSDPNL